MQDWGTSNPFAYSHFLEAGFYVANSNHSDLERAIEHYIAAIDEDPAFVPAHIGLARAASSLGSYSQQARNNELHALIDNAVKNVSRIDSQHEALPEMRNYLLWLEAGSKTLMEQSL